MIANTQRFEQKYLQFNNWRKSYAGICWQAFPVNEIENGVHCFWKDGGKQIFPSTVPPINKSKK
jgi:hypothetical protein